MVSKKDFVPGGDKEYFRKIGEALNPPIKKMTKKEWIQKVSFEKYIRWLCQGRELALLMPKARSLYSPQAEGAKRAFQRALHLGLIRYGKHPSSKGV